MWSTWWRAARIWKVDCKKLLTSSRLCLQHALDTVTVFCAVNCDWLIDWLIDWLCYAQYRFLLYIYTHGLFFYFHVLSLNITATPNFPAILQIRPGIVRARFLQSGCPFCDQANNISGLERSNNIFNILCSNLNRTVEQTPLGRDVNETLRSETRPRRLASSSRRDRDLTTFHETETFDFGSETETLIGRDRDIFRDLGKLARWALYLKYFCLA